MCYIVECEQLAEVSRNVCGAAEVAKGQPGKWRASKVVDLGPKLSNPRAEGGKHT